jgi:transposase
VIEPKECTCPDCGAALKDLGRDEAEVLEVKTVLPEIKRRRAD